jgi:hypothetical protein
MSKVFMRKPLGMRIVMVAIAAVMLCGVLTINASAINPAPPYFWLDEDFTDAPPMGNNTIADIEWNNDGEFLFFTQPEFFYDGHRYVGTIVDMWVYDAYAESGSEDPDPPDPGYINVWQNGYALVPDTYLQENDNHEYFFKFWLKIYVFDITAQEDFTHIELPVYFELASVL